MKRMILCAAMLAAVAAGVVLAQNSQTAEVRITARELEDGRIEFALQQRHGDGWGERQLATRRFFPANAAGRGWLSSSPYRVEFDERSQPNPVSYEADVEGIEFLIIGEPGKPTDVATIETAFSQAVHDYAAAAGVTVPGRELRFHVIYDLTAYLAYREEIGDPAPWPTANWRQWAIPWGGLLNQLHDEGEQPPRMLITLYANPETGIYARNNVRLLNARTTTRHEYVHALQFHLSGDYYAARAAGMPEWYIEGQATWATWSILEAEPGWEGWAANLAQRFKNVEEKCEGLPLEYARAGDYCAYQLGAMGIHMLAEDHGHAAVWNVWKRIGAGDDWPTAFRRAFGLSLERFYAQFAQFRTTWEWD